MGYHRKDGKFCDVETITLNPAEGTTITGDTESDVLELGDRAVARIRQNVTANAATSLDTTIQTGPTPAGPWLTVGTFAQVTTPAEETIVVLLDRFVKAVFNHTGSGAIVVTCEGEAA